MKLWNTPNNTQFNQSVAESMIPDFGNMSSAAQTTALDNFRGSDVGIQAGPSGQQSALQGFFFNAPNVNKTGAMTRGGLNLDNIGALASGIGSAANIYTALANLGMARDQFDFQKQAYNTNLANQTQSYNTALEDRIRARYSAQGGTAADVDAYLQKHSL